MRSRLSNVKSRFNPARLILDMDVSVVFHKVLIQQLVDKRQTPSQVSLSYARNPDLGRCAVGLIHWQRAKLGSLQLQA